WQVSYYLSPGERLGISVFPPRPFPWKESFESRFTIAHRGISPEIDKEWAKYGDVLILWNWTMRSWSFSWGREHVPYDLDDFRAHVRAAKDAGMTPIMYASCHWYYSRDADEYAAELRRMKDLVDIEGVYYDGIPGQEWVVAYEEMRMTREIFRDGKIIVHATGNNYNGHPPLLEPSIKIPAVETYSDATYTGELVNGEGRDWAYPKYIAAQYRLSNCIGVMKYDKWDGLTPLQRDLMMLRHNGRACLLPVEWEGMTDEGRLGYLRETYLPILDELRRLWEEKGSEPDFYEKHYLPRAIELTRGLLPE
ncbi:MAG: hypothetical protein MUQ26_08775, partial [Armatimonadetes bacterium]|nr:hypothetical protein [Armatimonadota bacterium]